MLLKERALTRRQKECILLTLAAEHENTYCVTAHWEMLRSLGMAERELEQLMVDHHQAELAETDVALVDFALKLGRHPTSVGRADFEALRGAGFVDEKILEIVLMAALTNFLCTLSVGLGVEPDFRAKELPPRGNGPWTAAGLRAASLPGRHAHREPYLRAVDMDPERFPPFAFFRQSFGFIPNIFRAQTLRPDVVESEARVVDTVLLSGDILPRVCKEYILLVVSAANLNTYCVAVHCEMLRGLGIPEDQSDQIAVNHRQAGLSEADVALLDFALKLAKKPAEYSASDVLTLGAHGFTAEQILESVVMTSLTTFLNTLQMGLGTVPDFPPRRDFLPSGASLEGPGRDKTNLLDSSRPPIIQGKAVEEAVPDPDASLVARVQKGDTGAFEELVRRHSRAVYRAVVAITGDLDGAEDDVQNAFLKAFTHIRQFRGASKWSTWLTRIAINEGIHRLRQRKVRESLDAFDREESEEQEFRPRQVRAWVDDPERLYSEAETRQLVERELMKLPAKYRAVVVLRDIEQLPGEHVAAALGLGVPTMKTRLLRGRLMLREALAPHFSCGERGSHA